MMEKFRNLSNNIFFKIFLGFLGLSFIMFGVSNFILGGKTSWVGKVGKKTISYDKFIEEFQNNKEVIYRANPNKEAMQYLNSDQFKQDVLNRMVTKKLIQSLQNKFKLYPNQDLILKEITTNENLKTKDGKFDRALYQNFLKSNGITEKQHLENLAEEIAGGLIVQSFTASPNSSVQIAKDIYQHRFQTRSADIITVSSKNVGTINNPNDFELNGFFEKNKDKFALPELRKVSFLAFDANNFNQELKVNDEEIEKEYQANKPDYQIPESANFYHILFPDEDVAKDFYQTIKSKENNSETFLNLAISKGKDKSSIFLSKINKNELPLEVANDAFRLSKNQYSEVLRSKLGFHIFYLLEKMPVSDIPLEQVSKTIKSKLLAKKEESQVRDGLKNAEDEILATNSLDKVAAKLNLNINKTLPKFNINGLDTKQKEVGAIKNLDNFIKNSFALEKGKVSKIFFSESNKKYYIVLVDDIETNRQRSLDEVKVLATDLWIADKKQQKLRELSEKISTQINQSGGNYDVVSIKHGLKVEKNRQFPRFYMIDAGNGRKVPYANKILNNIFSVQVNQATNPEQTGADEWSIALVRSIQNPLTNDAAVKAISEDAKNNFRNDILTSFNHYIQKEFTVEINNKLIQTNIEKTTHEQQK